MTARQSFRRRSEIGGRSWIELVVPQEMAEEIPDGVFFRPEWHEDGILFRVVEQEQQELPSWITSRRPMEPSTEPAGDQPGSSGDPENVPSEHMKSVGERRWAPDDGWEYELRFVDTSEVKWWANLVRVNEDTHIRIVALDEWNTWPKERPPTPFEEMARRQDNPIARVEAKPRYTLEELMVIRRARDDGRPYGILYPGIVASTPGSNYSVGIGSQDENEYREREVLLELFMDWSPYEEMPKEPEPTPRRTKGAPKVSTEQVRDAVVDVIAKRLKEDPEALRRDIAPNVASTLLPGHFLVSHVRHETGIHPDTLKPHLDALEEKKIIESKPFRKGKQYRYVDPSEITDPAEVARKLSSNPNVRVRDVAHANQGAVEGTGRTSTTGPNKEVTEMIRKSRQQGFMIEQRGNGHIRVKHPQFPHTRFVDVKTTPSKVGTVSRQRTELRGIGVEL